MHNPHNNKNKEKKLNITHPSKKNQINNNLKINKNKNLNKKSILKSFIHDLIIMTIVIIITVILIKIFPEKKHNFISISKNFFIEMITILPAVMILMGLFNVFVSKDIIVKYLGESAGIKSIFFGILLGSLPTGPLYVAFPIASALLKKGAKISCIIAFLSAWGCIKIPQELVELQFLGWKFMLLRLFLTIIFVVVMSIIIEKLINIKKK